MVKWILTGRSMAENRVMIMIESDERLGIKRKRKTNGQGKQTHIQSDWNANERAGQKTIAATKQLIKQHVNISGAEWTDERPEIKHIKPDWQIYRRPALREDSPGRTSGVTDALVMVWLRAAAREVVAAALQPSNQPASQPTTMMIRPTREWNTVISGNGDDEDNDEDNGGGGGGQLIPIEIRMIIMKITMEDLSHSNDMMENDDTATEDCGMMFPAAKE